MTTELRRTTRPRARLTRQGQITVPKLVREALGLRPGDELEFVARGEEMLVAARPRRSILDFAGLGAAAAGLVPATAEALDELVDRGMGDAAAARERRVREPRTRRKPPPTP